MFTRLSIGLLTCLASASAQELFPAYLPLDVGNSWKYVDDQDAANFFYVDAVAPLSLIVPGAVILGDDAFNGWIVTNDGVEVKLHGVIEAGVVTPFHPPIVMGLVSDGATFQISPTDVVVIREWSALDPALLAGVGGYGVDPAEPDLLVWVWYDTLQPPGMQNPILESGGVPQTWGVTDVEWFKKGSGFFASQSVDAALTFDPVSGTWVYGALLEHYDVFPTFDCDDNQVPDHLDPDCNLDEIPDACQPSSETVSLGFPPNLSALLPGVTSGPVLGAIWDPIVDHSTFFPGAALDFLGISAVKINVPTSLGTLLINPPALGLTFVATPGVSFSIAIPSDCALIGAAPRAQAGSVDGGGLIGLTNALDFVVGAI